MSHDEPELRLIYGGTTGYVAGSDTSKGRAESEARSGVARKRLQTVLDALQHQPRGLIWKQLGALLSLHHGQVSGALSTLHKAGEVFQIRERRGNCHPYVHRKFLGDYHPSQVILEPSSTRSGTRNALTNEVIKAAREVTWHMDGAMERLTDAIRRLDQAT